MGYFWKLWATFGLFGLLFIPIFGHTDCDVIFPKIYKDFHPIDFPFKAFDRKCKLRNWKNFKQFFQHHPNVCLRNRFICLCLRQVSSYLSKNAFIQSLSIFAQEHKWLCHSYPKFWLLLHLDQSITLYSVF